MKKSLLLVLILITVAFAAHPIVWACDAGDPTCDHHPTDLKDFGKQLASCQPNDAGCRQFPDTRDLIRLVECDAGDPTCGHHPTDVFKGLMELAYGQGDGIKGPALDKELKQVAKLSADGPLRFMGIPRSQSPGMRKDPGKDDQDRISLDLTEEQLAEAPAFKKFLNMRVPVNATDRNGTTMLMIASSKGNVKVVKTLLDKGADVNLVASNGGTALMFAAAKGNPEVVKLLLHAGADPKWKNKSGATALFWAKKKGHEDVVKILLAGKADD